MTTYGPTEAIATALTAVILIALLAGVVYLTRRAVLARRRAREARAILTERAREPSELSRHLRADPEAARAGAEAVALDPHTVPTRTTARRGPDGRFLPHTPGGTP